MSTHVTTHHPVRSDLGTPAPATPAAAGTPATAAPSRRWALAGLGAAVSSIIAGAMAPILSAVYDQGIATDAPAIAEELSHHLGAMIVFHVFNTVAALLLVVVAFGLHRRLRAALPDGSTIPGVAAFGLLATSLVLVVGTALDTEFIFALSDPASVLPESAAFYNHWVATVASCWVMVGVTALAVFAAARRGAVARWQGWVALVLGGLTLLVAIAPAQYMAGATGGLWLLVASIGFLAGDRAHRRA